MLDAANFLSRLKAELLRFSGETEFLKLVEEAESRGSSKDFRIPLADWVCRTVTPVALEVAGLSTQAASLREVPALTLETDPVWEQRLGVLVESLAHNPEVASYERGDYKALITVLDVEWDCALAFCAQAIERAIGPDLKALALASRLIRQLVGPAVVEYDRVRDWSGEPWAGEDREGRAEARYKPFFAAETLLVASLASLLQ
jgi:hypothetical protein